MAGLFLIAIIAVVALRRGDNRERSRPLPSVVASDATTRGLPSAASPRRLRSRLAAVGRREASAIDRSKSDHEFIQAKLQQLRERDTGDEGTRSTVMYDLLAIITDDNAAATAQALTPEDLRTEFGTAAVIHWLTVDPAGGGAWLARGTDLTLDQAADIGRAMEKLPAVLDGISGQLPEGPWKQALLNGAALNAADHDPAKAIELAARMHPGGAQSNVYETAAYTLALQDPLAAERWITAIEDPLLRNELLAIGAKALAATDPDLAAAWCSAAIPTGSAFNETALSIVAAWSARDPARAADWVTGFPPSTARNAAIVQVLRQWAVADSAAATVWLLALPDHPAIMAQLRADQSERREPKP